MKIYLITCILKIYFNFLIDYQTIEKLKLYSFKIIYIIMEQKEDVIILENGEVTLSNELKKKISDKVKELHEKDTKLKRVFPFVIMGDEYDSKPFYVIYIKEPSLMQFSKYMTLQQSDATVAMRTLANDCYLDGDKELISDDSLFLFGLSTQLGQIIQVRNGSLVNLSKAGK